MTPEMNARRRTTEPVQTVAPRWTVGRRMVYSLLGAIGVAFLGAVLLYRSPDAKKHVYTNYFILSLTDKHYNDATSPLMQGFENVTSADGDFKAEYDSVGNMTSFAGSIRLTDGRDVAFNRIYTRDSVVDKSTVTDLWGRTFQNDLVEKFDERGRTVAIEGTITDSFGRKHKIHRKYRHVDGSTTIHVNDMSE